MKLILGLVSFILLIVTISLTKMSELTILLFMLLCIYIGISIGEDIYDKFN